MKRILFVCHGNICRSAMAKMIMVDMLKQQQLTSRFEIDSCATSTEEIGNDIYPPAKKCLAQHGIAILPHAARQITKADYAYFDLILCMEQYNIRNLRYTLGEELLAEDMSLPQPKIMRLLNRDVADPWYTRDFEATYKDLVEGCTRLINECK